MIKEELEQRNLPKLLVSENGTKIENITQWEGRRKEIKEILDNFLIGIVPPLKPKTRGKIERTDENAVAGKAIYHFVDIEINTTGGFFQFPVHMMLPKKKKKPPIFLYLSFEPNLFNFAPWRRLSTTGTALSACFIRTSRRIRTIVF